MALAGAGLAMAPLHGCKNRGRSGGLPPISALQGEGAGRIVIDGEFNDWPAGRSIVGDEDFVYFRVRVEGSAPMPLSAMPETLSLVLDADGDARTGVRMPSPAEASGLGVDLMVEFSPGESAGGVGRGARVVAFDAAGATRTEIPHTAARPVAAPTHASSEFEIRIDRHSEQGRRFERGLGARGGTVTGMFVLTDASGTTVGWSDPESARLPERRSGEPRSDALVPTKPQGAVRVVSYNVLRGALVGNPQPFARMIQVLDPDVILFQEWDATPASAAGWMTATVTGKPSWNARAGEGGVLIVSPWPIEALGPDFYVLPPDSPAAGNRPGVRFVSGLVRTPAGDVAVGSGHLKCCGTAGSSEDVRRIAEAGAINGQLMPAMSAGGPTMRVIGGDMNLVGTRTPLDLIRAGLDVDGSELEVVQPRILGDGAFFTWRDDTSTFPPSRLDFLMVGESGARVINAFVLDTSRLSDRALATMGLDRGDSASSDHLPVVVDLIPR